MKKYISILLACLALSCANSNGYSAMTLHAFIIMYFPIAIAPPSLLSNTRTIQSPMSDTMTFVCKDW